MNLKLQNILKKRKQYLLFKKNKWKLFFQLSNLELEFLNFRKNIQFLTYSKFSKIKNSMFISNFLFKSNVLGFFLDNFFFFIKSFLLIVNTLTISLFFFIQNKQINYSFLKLKNFLEIENINSKKEFTYIEYQSKFINYFFILFFFYNLYLYKIFALFSSKLQTIFFLKKNAND